MKAALRTLASVALLNVLLAYSVFAQATNPPYIGEFPPVDKVMKAMETGDPDETVGRQVAALWQLQQMILDLAGPRQFQKDGLTPDEQKARQAYYAAYFNLSHQAPAKSVSITAGLSSNPTFRNTLIQQVFPPAFAADYPKLMAQSKQARVQVHQQSVEAAEAKAKADRAVVQKALDQAREQFEAQQRDAKMGPEAREMRRCVTAGRVFAVCVGHGLMNSLLPNLNGMLSAALPSMVGKEVTGPQMAGVFTGSGWRMEFTDATVALSCQDMIADSHAYKISFENNRAVLDIANAGTDVVLNVDGDRLAGSGPIAVQGRIYLGEHYGFDPISGQNANIRQYQQVTRNCPQPVLTKNSSAGMVGTEQNILVSMFNDGEAGPPTPAGLRMHGIYAAGSGFSAEFFPESVILGCGPDVARAYPYSVLADGKQAQVKVDAPSHPLTLAIKPNNVLDPGSGPYQVEGRKITGQDANGDYTFAPLNATCKLAPLSPGPVPSAPVMALH
jgi:hypothetical protein